MQAQHDLFIQSCVHFLQRWVNLMMDLYLKLLSLIKVAIGNNLDDQHGQVLGKIILSWHHSLHLWVVDSKFLLTDLINLASELLDKKVELFWVVDWEMDVECKKTHECQHYFFLEAVVADLPMDHWELELCSGLVAFVQFLLLRSRKIVVAGVKILKSVSEEVNRRLALFLFIVDLLYGLIVV